MGGDSLSAQEEIEKLAMKDRCRGTLLGLAVGDALGAAVEFETPGSFESVTGYRSGRAK